MKIRLAAILAVLMLPVPVGAAPDEKISQPPDWQVPNLKLGTEEQQQNAREQKPNGARVARYNSTSDMRACLELHDSLKVIYCVEHFH